MVDAAPQRMIGTGIGNDNRRDPGLDAMGIDGVAHCEDWELVKPFIISRGPTTHITVLVVELRDGSFSGRGESCPIEYCGETPESVAAQAEAILDQLGTGASWGELHDRSAPGAARNAVDCAYWDLMSKRAGQPAWSLLGLEQPRPVETVYTISLDDPESMVEAARAATAHKILKLKLGAPGDVERVKSVRAAVPEKRLIVDVNEGWEPHELEANLQAMARFGVEMVEQPLRAGADEALANVDHVVPICADESCHTSADLPTVKSLYDVVNIKLDKTGGLTEAIRLLTEAKLQDMDTMVGCMLGTSLAMAPAILVAQQCRFVDLDAPLLIGHDRTPGLDYQNGMLAPSHSELWG